MSKLHMCNANGENPVADMIDEKGILDRIEELQEHKNESIYKKAQKILVNHYQEEDTI